MVNKQIILGRIGNDLELRHTAAGSAVLNLSVATDHVYKGEKETTWHRCVLFGKKAEVVAEHFSKGSGIYIEGRTTSRKWTDKDGQEKLSHEVLVNEFSFVPGGSSGKPSKPAQGNMMPRDDLEDDLPF